MSFTESIYRLDAYHTAFLESGGRDDVSLEFAINAAAAALRQAPPARLPYLSPDQQGEVKNLYQIWEQMSLPDAYWDRPSRLQWLAQANELLLLLRD
jgi:hypothetical protein